jgi:hypothetical protein
MRIDERLQRINEVFDAVRQSMAQFTDLQSKNHLLRRQYKEALDGLVASVHAASTALTSKNN